MRKADPIEIAIAVILVLFALTSCIKAILETL